MKPIYDDPYHVAKREAARRSRARKRGENVPSRAPGNPQGDVGERFHARVDRSGDGCWLWLGARDPRGYGRISVGGRGGKMEGAHRVAYALAYGPIPDGAHVLHSCDNPPCVNPAHLSAGTHHENMRDMAVRCRSARTKLTPEQVIEILGRLHAERQRDLAREFGVAKATIGAIARRETWSHLCGPDDRPVVVVDPMTVVAA